MARNPNDVKTRAVIAFYKKLLKSNRVQQNGPAYRRLIELEKRHEQQTRWFGIRYKEGSKIRSDYVLAHKDLN